MHGRRSFPMSFVVTARKWRPVTFAQVVGQGHVTRTLTNALQSGRVAHALLFCGPRGVGKTTVARILARALNCEASPAPEPCGVCSACREAQSGRALDIIEMDAASHRSVEEARQLRESVRLAPSSGRWKVYIIDEVHMLTREAFNTLLKTLEEPPPGVVFVLATTDPLKVPSTIISRCQRFDFRRIPEPVIVEQLSRIAAGEGIEAESEALAVLSQEAEGAMRDAQSLFDQVIAFSGDKLTVQAVYEVLGLADNAWYLALLRAITGRDAAGVLRLAHDAVTAGKDISELVVGLLRRLRDVLVVRVAGSDDPGGEFDEAWVQAATSLSEGDLLRMLRIVGELELVLARSADQRLALEVALVRLAQLDRTVNLEALLAALGAAPAPQATLAPEVTLAPQATVAPQATLAPEVTLAPQATVAPEAAQTPAMPESLLPPAEAGSGTTVPEHPRPAAEASASAASESPRPAAEKGSAPGWWETFLSRLRTKDRTLWTSLSMLVFRDVADGAVRLGVAGPDGRFAAQQVQKKQEWLEEQLSELRGERLRLELGPLGEAREEPGAREAPRESPSGSDPWMARFDGAKPAIEKVLGVLGAEVVEPPVGSREQAMGDEADGEGHGTSPQADSEGSG